MRGVYVFHEVVLHDRSLHEKCLLDVQQAIIPCLVSLNENKLEISQAFLALAAAAYFAWVWGGLFNFQVLEEFTSLDLVYSCGP